jgi:hypothetical protein
MASQQYVASERIAAVLYLAEELGKTELSKVWVAIRGRLLLENTLCLLLKRETDIVLVRRNEKPGFLKNPGFWYWGSNTSRQHPGRVGRSSRQIEEVNDKTWFKLYKEVMPSGKTSSRPALRP